MKSAIVFRDLAFGYLKQLLKFFDYLFHIIEENIFIRIYIMDKEVLQRMHIFVMHNIYCLHLRFYLLHALP